MMPPGNAVTLFFLTPLETAWRQPAQALSPLVTPAG